MKGAGRVYFTSPPKAWARNSLTKGWRDTAVFNYAHEVPHARITSIGTDSIKFETYVYRLPDASAPTGERYFPASPLDAAVAFTAVGNPQVAGVDDEITQRLDIRAAPNPGLHGVWIDLSLPRKGHARVSVQDVSGRTVAVLSDQDLAAGLTRLRWLGVARDGSRCGAGMYWVRVESDDGVASRRFVLFGSQR